MRILSIYTGHNAAVCILENGKVLINWELERFSRIKHDYGFNEAFLSESLRICGCGINDIDFIAINRGLVDDCIVREGTQRRAFDVPETCKYDTVPFSVNYKGKDFQALAINHHLAHAASAYFTSPYNEAAILTYDGFGDAENSSVGFGQANKITRFKRGFLSDLAHWWASLPINNYLMPRIHERDPGSSAGKIMALAAYGKKDDILMARLEMDIEKGLRLDTYPSPDAYAFNNAENLSDTQSARSQNLAWALQQKTEEMLQQYFNMVASEFPKTKNICYAGGTALNCVANSRALSYSPFTSLFIPPCPNDSGIALGMALYAYHHHLNHARIPKHFSAYTGPQYSGTMETFVQLAEANGLQTERCTMERIADILCEREIAAVFMGRSECGPRALGNRSIICLPDRENCRDELNFKVKKREWYRPYGAIILDTAVADVLEEIPDNSAYMNTCGVIKPEWRQKLNGANHIDNTTRPQILKKEHHPFLYNLLEEVYRRSGIPALLNTSFNLHEPMAETPQNSMHTFLKLPLNYLVTDELIIKKQ